MAPERKQDTSVAAGLVKFKASASAVQKNTQAVVLNPPLVTSIERYKPLVGSQSGFFLILSQEVRDMIYDKVWGDAHTTSQRFQHTDWNITYDGGNDSLDFSISARWLLTNKQMLEQGVQQLHQKSTCHLNEGDNNIPCGPDTPQLLKPFQARSYAIHLQREPFIFDEDQRTYRINSTARTQINQTLGWTDSMSPVRSFQIHSRRPVQEPALVRTKADFEFDLRHLESLKGHEKLGRLEIRVICNMDDSVALSTRWRIKGAIHARRLEDHYFDTLSSEIIRVGQSLIGDGKRRGYMKETTRESDGIRELRWGWVFEKL
ncbi:hypothetical protein G6011_04889 [Alternaria panax]|uniref:Uncharacterized protein n=1 Tax=Alternaria panax TaxID=48097 RepID=A0AAD4IIB3_9PLEO|nr:hypothetical protein G6011_04889 [Alternaria panax]